MRSRRISKRGLASSEGTITVGACPLPMIVLATYGRVPAVAGDGHKNSGLELAQRLSYRCTVQLSARAGCFDMNYHKPRTHDKGEVWQLFLIKMCFGVLEHHLRLM
ncbi:hypothetical protein AVEN_165331-1 [Araneus ventricosus]|uniref:Uncharacterized protein n=1 Tax=Araneus ventricosus TaxID=182803 RepID=A0A4Y2ASY5_ARAVE|nr:hypothetical protein AVEN_165331-1 [Araneus ventricosus]